MLPALRLFVLHHLHLAIAADAALHGLILTKFGLAKQPKVPSATAQQ